MHQVFKSLHISIFNFDLKLKLNPTTHHLYYSWYAFFIILNLAYISNNFYASNQVKSRPTYSPLSMNVTGLYIRSFYYLVNVLTLTKSIMRHVILIKLISTQKKVLAMSSWLFIPTATKDTWEWYTPWLDK